MARVEIRRLKGDNIIKIYHPMMDYNFRSSPMERNFEDEHKRLHFLDENQIYALFEDDHPVASATNIPMTQHIRGKIFAMGGVQGVATYPQARRKGYARQIVEFLFRQMREQQQSLSTLYPFRESFYERLGYAPFPQWRVAVFSPNNLHHLLSRDLPGTVQMMDIKSGYERYLHFLNAMQPRIHGLSLYPETRQRRLREENRYWVAFAVDAQGLDIAMMLYNISAQDRLLKAEEVLYQNNLGKYLLLHWLGRHIDQVTKAELYLPPGESIETSWSDLDVRYYTPYERGKMNAPMGRVVMVEGIAGMSVGDGSFTAHIHDRQCPWNSSIYTFASRDGKLTVTPAESSAMDCDLQIQGLSALVFTGTDPADFEWRGWGNPSPRIQAMMREMFPPAQPYLLKPF